MVFCSRQGVSVFSKKVSYYQLSMRRCPMIKTYYLLTKPGILMGNAITLVGGFAMASKGHFDFPLFAGTTAGLGGVISSACVFNNYIDRERDAKMERTKNRALVKGIISPRNAVIFASILGVVGTLILALTTNALAVTAALAGFFIYVVLYGIWKSRSVYGTLIGSMAGAAPPVVGYCAVTNHFDAGALLLFAILVLWQMPHFYAIAMYRFNDYVAASIPVLPVKKGVPLTKIRMLLYIIAFTTVSLLLTLMGYTGYAYLIVAALLGLSWLVLCLKGFKSENDKPWARQMFFLSLVIITVLCGMISFDFA